MNVLDFSQELFKLNPTATKIIIDSDSKLWYEYSYHEDFYDYPTDVPFTFFLLNYNLYDDIGIIDEHITNSLIRNFIEDFNKTPSTTIISLLEPIINKKIFLKLPYDKNTISYNNYKNFSIEIYKNNSIKIEYNDINVDIKDFNRLKKLCDCEYNNNVLTIKI